MSRITKGTTAHKSCTALDLPRMPPAKASDQFGVVQVSTLLELCGQGCISLELPPYRQSSRSSAPALLGAR